MSIIGSMFRRLGHGLAATGRLIVGAPPPKPSVAQVTPPAVQKESFTPPQPNYLTSVGGQATTSTAAIQPVNLGPAAELQSVEDSLKFGEALMSGFAQKVQRGDVPDAAFYEFQGMAVRSVAEAARTLGPDTPVGKQMMAKASAMNGLVAGGPANMGQMTALFKEAQGVVASSLSATPKSAMAPGTAVTARAQLDAIEANLSPLMTQMNGSPQVLVDPKLSVPLAASVAKALEGMANRLGPDDPLGRLMTSQSKFLQLGVDQGATTVGVDAYLALHRLHATLDARRDTLPKGGTIASGADLKA